MNFEWLKETENLTEVLSAIEDEPRVKAHREGNIQADSEEELLKHMLDFEESTYTSV